MTRTLLLVAALAGFSAVALGAFGAHGLKSRVEPELLAVWQTAVQYHLAHALALLFVALLLRQAGGHALLWSGGAFAAGIVLFSGSLYLLVLTGVRTLGIITPFGGLAFLAGWLALAVAAFRNEF
jgi:uncharacterized membrane protein YgdD (TMEM256/DUF423 family)